jgi:hypothetical protein
MTALVGQVLIIATNLRERLERAMETNLDPEVRDALEKAKLDAEALIHVARQAGLSSDT